MKKLVNGKMLDLTQDEITARQAEVAAWEAGAAQRAALAELKETETLKDVSRKLEEVIDYIENGTPLSSQAKDWMSGRKIKREALK